MSKPSLLIDTGADLEGGGVSRVVTPPPPPNDLSYNIKCSTADTLSHGDALIYIAKVVVVVKL